MGRRIGWLAAVVAVLIIAAVAVPSSQPARPTAPAVTATAMAASPVASTAESVAPGIAYPQVGPDTFDVATVGGPVAGVAGALLRYRVAVEEGITGITANQFALAVEATLSDPRSWIGTGDWRLQLVPAGTAYDFTIYLVTPATRDLLCQDGYDRYTSCRKDDSVVLNVVRWVQGVPEFGDDLAGYREYMVNHETGHRLHWGHELCPGPGQLAPVMQQQSLGLHGCLPNSWPVVDGKPYHGVSGQYDDQPPPA